MDHQASTIAAGKAPTHIWVVGVISLLWNAFGAYDYTMTNLRDPGYVAQFPPEMMDVIDAFPMWTMAAWALGVWGALAGSVLLLMRSRFAVHAFAVSLAGLAGSQVYQATIDLPEAMTGGAMMAMTAVIWIGALAFLWYAWKQAKAGVLR
jgi:hypothetical protein